MKRSLLASLAALLAVTLPQHDARAGVHAARVFEYKTLDYDYAFDEDAKSARSLIYMLPDGTGPNVFTLARTVLDPTLKTRLHVDDLLMGQVQTHSTTSYVTDSAAAATAYATGFKTYSGAIGVDHFQQPVGNIIEAAKARGMVTGMIVTSSVTDATPAAFATHTANRNSEDDIAKQFVANKNLDFLLGGGGRYFTDAMYSELKGAGYAVVKNWGELLDYKAQNEASGALRVFGIFKDYHMSFELDRAREAAAAGEFKTDREPSLPEMVDTVLSILKNNPVAKKNGFFMLIEGSRVDHAGHANDAGAVAREAITFDETVGVVKDFVSSNDNVALISAADHATGGLTLGTSNIQAWKPRDLQKQTMSTEWMMAQLVDKFKSCGSDAAACKATLLQTTKDLLSQFTNVTTSEITEQLKKEIATAVDSSKSFNDVRIQLGRIISQSALIGWTSLLHVGTDVDLHCMGPSVLERLCKGLHENTHINKIMTNYLNLGHRLDAETLRLRNFKTLEYTPGADVPPL